MGAPPPIEQRDTVQLLRDFRRHRWVAVEKAGEGTTQADKEAMAALKRAALIRKELLRRKANVPF
jgi:hypothetical protein